MQSSSKPTTSAQADQAPEFPSRFSNCVEAAEAIRAIQFQGHRDNNLTTLGDKWLTSARLYLHRQAEADLMDARIQADRTRQTIEGDTAITLRAHATKIEALYNNLSDPMRPYKLAAEASTLAALVLACIQNPEEE